MSNMGPETRAMLNQFTDMNKKLEAIRYSLSGIEEPSGSVKRGALYHQQTVLDKTAAFAATAVNTLGFNFVKISTDGDLQGISYNVEYIGGRAGPAIQAESNPTIVGHHLGITITNIQAQPGRTVYIDKYLAPWIMLSAMQHGTPESIRETRLTFRLARLQEAAAAAPFSTSQAKNVLPTFLLDTEILPAHIAIGLITRIHYRINPTNAVTYTLRLWRAAVNGAVAPYEENLAMLYESAAARVDDTDYDILDREIPFWLPVPGNIYYSLEWSAAPGNCSGIIEVSGVKF